MDNQLSSTLLIPTLNEIEALQVVMPQIKREWVDQILIVDGGSTDGSIEYLEKNGYSVHICKKRGFGMAMQEGLSLTNNEIIVEFTSDGSSLAEKIPELIEKIKNGKDLVIASRYKGNAKSEDDDFFTAIGNKIFTTIVNVLFRARYTDVLVGFRAYKRSQALKVGMNSAGLSWPCQSSIRFAKAGLKVDEIPADEPKRIGGVRKMKPIKTGWEILKLILRDFLFFDKKLDHRSK